jgi:hypothetical protein
MLSFVLLFPPPFFGLLGEEAEAAAAAEEKGLLESEDVAALALVLEATLAGRGSLGTVNFVGAMAFCLGTEGLHKGKKCNGMTVLSIVDL